ncbi:MAG TPA: sigma-54 dependent transcriptional regulator [Candidatus Baltobacteraceae bacterium]|jgi:DNA-binding NtrC family response regulator|nr:sigma-54 dependent transcriptional regulator [Candidatus Baltobacteraceae bacterium]
MTTPKILIIEDEAALATALATVCERIGAEATLCASGQLGLEELARANFSLVILDIGLPDISGWSVLETVNQTVARPPVLIITAHGTLDNAIASRQLSATAYLVKPLDLRELERTIRDLLAEAASVGSTPPARSEVGVLLGGASPEMQRVFVTIAQAATTDAPALITGPTGTGKTLTAHVIHANSRRRDGPFVTLLCGSLPEQLLESELFGHEKNAFTGAGAMRPGHLERAVGGTLFLDEIGDIPPAVQAKLLRFVEEKTFNRVGGREDLRVDLRLITATHRSLREEVQAARFREDLYYRLHVLEVELPPLARRCEDIPALSAFFLSQISAGRELALGSNTSRVLARYSWPGNVRELRNALEHAVAVCSGKIIQPHHLPKAVRLISEASSSAELDEVLQRWAATRIQAGTSYKELYAEFESALLKHLMQHFDQKPSVLARVLKMNRATLLKKRRHLGLES